MRISIIICTCHFHTIKECLESLLKVSDLEKADAEVIIAMNGCELEARQYVESLGPRFRYIWVDRRAGLCTMTNLAAKIADGEYLVRLDDDAYLLEWGNNNLWLDWLLRPFLEDPMVGQSGPCLEAHPGGYVSLIGFLTMTKKEIWEKIGGLDTIFDPGGHEDKDYSMKVQKLGYKVVSGTGDGSQMTPVEGLVSDLGFPIPFTANYPIYHISRVDYNLPHDIHKKNEIIFKERYGFTGIYGK
jgi:glycosyltransferase involved in cell wall biosynthesis